VEERQTAPRFRRGELDRTMQKDRRKTSAAILSAARKVSQLLYTLA
jgi:hypothetical protein